MNNMTRERRVARYRRQLEIALAALPAHELTDLAQEVESHLREAADEGRLDDYLAEIGEPGSFASEILIERGLLPDPDTVPEAPRWRRLMAGAIDLVVALAPFALSLVVSLLLVLPEDVDRWVAGALLLAMVGITLGWTVWYWRSRTRRGGRASAGMTLMDLRSVRAGGKARVVRRSSVAGEGFRLRGLVVAVVLLGFASLLLFPLLYEVAVAFPRRQAAQNIESAMRAASSDVSGAMHTVSSFGAALDKGATEAQLLRLATPEALEAVEDLRQRGRGGELGGLVLLHAYQPDYGTAKQDFEFSDATIVIEAYEQKNESRHFRFTVRKDVDIQETEWGFMSSADYIIVGMGPAD
jgi:uncharacterized membrane protein